MASGLWLRRQQFPLGMRGVFAYNHYGAKETSAKENMGGIHMREYMQGTETIIKKAVCNQCGKALKTDGDTMPEDWLSVDKAWGYFSGKDGETHSFDLCEECYDKLVKGFAVPVTVTERRELL